MLELESLKSQYTGPWLESAGFKLSFFFLEKRKIGRSQSEILFGQDKF